MNEEDLRYVLDQLEVYELDQKGKWLNTTCPLSPWTHERGTDNKPSFGVMIDDEQNSHYTCFSCNYSGTVSSLAVLLGRFREENYRPLITKINMYEANKNYRTWDEKKALKRIKREEKQIVALDDNKYKYPSANGFQEAIDYLRSRENPIDPKVIDILNLQYYETEKRIVFPVYHTDKKLYGFTGRTILNEDDYPVYESGRPFPKVRDFSGLNKERFILGSHLWEKGKPVLIQEGLMGLAYTYGIGADEYFNLGATMGARLTDYQASILIEFGETVYLLYDNDQAGDVALYGKIKDEQHQGNGAVDKLKKNIPVKVPEWVENKYDPDELSLSMYKDILYNTELITY